MLLYLRYHNSTYVINQFVQNICQNLQFETYTLISNNTLRKLTNSSPIYIFNHTLDNDLYLKIIQKNLYPLHKLHICRCVCILSLVNI